LRSVFLRSRRHLLFEWSMTPWAAADTGMTAQTEAPTNESPELPTGRMARARVAGVLAAKIGARRVGKAARKLIGQAATAGSDEESEAEMVFEALSHLRGPALKLAQTLSMESDLLPEAYRREFQKAHYQAPSLGPAAVRRLLTSEFLKPPEQVFESVDLQAFAAASIGQVHHAKSRNGESLAVKVQYPGVRKAVLADLTMVRYLLTPLLRSPYVSRVMTELEARFVEEVDYRGELSNTAWFHERLTRHGLRAPRPHLELSTSMVLTTDLLPGVHLREWLSTNPPQQVRDRAAQSIWDIFCISFFDWGQMHADPNPGNYLFEPDGTVGVIDFGCVKKIAPELADTVARYMRAELRGDRAVLRDMLERLGVNLDSLSEEGWKLLEEMGRLKSLPFKEESCDFRTQLYDPAKMTELARASRDFLKRGSFDGQTTETVMFDRNLRGLFNMFRMMGARVRLRNRWIY
jgi:predicted unusual protein kinase regulating ubiquinone biosynthesis (AarF/ABC1/UbiB family)